MPYDSNESLPKGVKGLPASQQTKWRKVFNSAYEGTCKDSGDRRDECASRVAWGSIDDKYKGKSTPLTEFSMRLKSVTHFKEKDQLRWKMVASDTDEDYYKDNMSMDLFHDFINRIDIKELAPTEFRSEFWQGGMPYISVSHYPDLDGNAVPGIVEGVYVDGNQLQAKGQFNKDKLGHACYHACVSDLYADPKPDNPIRVSIAFLDYGHIHKSNNFEFERKNIDDICPECVMEQIRGEISGKIFKKGQLVHLALTRVPANERTSMEVEKSMTTRKEDAASIIGEELADELDEKAKLVGKSQALIIKSEDEPEEEKDEPEPELVVVEESMHNGEEDEYECPDGMSEEDCKKHQDKMKEKKSVLDEKLERIEKMLSEITTKEQKVVNNEIKAQHELDPVFEQFKSDYDSVKLMSIPAEEKLRMLQDSSNRIGEEVRSHIITHVEPEPNQANEVSNDLVQALSIAMSNAVQPLAAKLDLLVTQQSEFMVKSTSEVNTAIPVRRSIAPTLSMQNDIKQLPPIKQKQSETPKLRALLEQNLRRATQQNLD